MRSLFFALSLLMASSSFAQRFPVGARQQDLNYVATQLPKLHANFFFQLQPAQFQAAVDSLNAKIATLSDTGFYVQLAALVAMAGDAHTALALNGSAAAAVGFQQFPLQFRWLDDGVFVTSAPAQYSRAVGNRLVKVGDFPIDQAIQKLATVISHGNDQWVHYMAQQYLAGQQVLQGLGLAPVGPTSPLTFRTLAGNEFTLDVGTETAPPALTGPNPNVGTIPDYLQNSGLNYWFTYFPQNRLLYFKYNRCTEMPSNPFATFAANVLRTFDANPVDTFVFDFRGNTGGNGSVIDPLLEGIKQRLPVLASNPRFRLYDVIDKGTFSSGKLNAQDLKQPLPPEAAVFFPGVDTSKLVISIGEPTGGKPAEYGEVLPFTLPSSNLAGQYSTTYFPNPAWVPDAPSFMPDIPVSIRSTDFFARFDPVMAAILARSNGALPGPSGSAITVNAASSRVDQGIAPGSYASAYGAFSQTPDQVLVAGLAGAIVSASASQVNFIVPAKVSTGTATMSVRAGGQELASGQVTITAAGPGLFVQFAADPEQPGAVENEDYAVNSVSRPAARGSVLQIFATGYGPLDSSGNAPVQVFLADTPAEVLYSAPVTGLPGLWQINARVPAAISGQAPLFLVAGGLVSNAVTVVVQ